ncbi:autotransporter outer membrane beta-barrel domain-containing protein [Aureimonas populi]|uniref:Autotransporter domain-containing protein n=1 Tax=Aureimonas populi TaxID=1701758 RepID=A0ABW5CKF5_9HYPH|nr:autotransporter domain-containing protein [Aureimonas populi]
MRFRDLAATTSILTLLASMTPASAAEPFAMLPEDVEQANGPFQMQASDLVYSGSERADGAEITRNTGESVTFTDDASAADARIVVNDGGSARFAGRAAGENAVLTNNAQTSFEDASNAGSARIVNNGSGDLSFAGQASAGGAEIENNGALRFSDRSSAGTAGLINNESGTVVFTDEAGGGDGGLLNNSGAVRFEARAQAGSRFIANNETGQVTFADESGAGAAVIANSGGVDFTGQASLGEGQIVGNAGSSVRFTDDSSAGAGRIAHAGQLTFDGRSTAATALIETQTGGATYFAQEASGGLAEMRLQDDAVLDFSALTSGATSVGSLLGTGRVFLGGLALTVGGNGLMTTVGGLADGGVAGGTGGSLVKVGDQILRLEGENSYTGPTRVAAGTLQAASANAFAPLSAVTVASGALLDVAGFDQTIGSLAGEGAVDLASNTLTLGGDGRSSEFAGTFAGAGGFAKVGGGVFRVTGASAIFGPSSVQDGTLLLDGGLSLAPIAVFGTGTIAGAGRAGSLTVADGGTLLADGPSLSIAGNLTLGAGALHSVVLSDTLAPLAVDGAVLIEDASRLRILAAQSFEAFRAYTLVEAAGGLTGQYGAVESDFAFLAPELSYDANRVLIALERNEVPFSEAVGTPNGRGVAGVLDRPAPGTPLYDALVRLDRSGAAAAFDWLSGEVHASIGTGLIEDTRHIRKAADERLRAARSMPEIAFATSGPDRGAARAVGGAGAWMSGFGSWGESDGDGKAASLARDTAGLLLGADALIADMARVGLLAGYSRSAYDLDERASSADVESVHVGAYAGTQLAGFNLRGGAAYGWHEIEAARSVAFAHFTDTLFADYGARTAQLFGELGYGLALGAAEIEPFAGLAYVHLDMDGWAESGGAAALAAPGARHDATLSTLGLRASSRMFVGGLDVTTKGMLGWRRVLAGEALTARPAFAGSDAFIVSGVPVSRNSAVVELGLDVGLSPNAELSLNYIGQFGSGSTDNGINAGFSYRF